MSCFLPEKKKQLLLPSKKAWRSFTSKLQSKILKIKRSKPIKQATIHLNTILRPRSPSPHRLDRHDYKRPRAYTKKLHHYHSFAPVYVDDLFQSQPERMGVDHIIEQQTQVSTKKPLLRNSTMAATSTSSSSSHFDSTSCSSVDERAEMFIAKFKQDMRLQRQKSLDKYQEMLARSV
ncbi:Uncharacterized protein M6B38_248465 [Iris pallida]|uniref:DUF761 domain-containing protein n=1 Tax=Iris pallida TaxID=29817 RepID=A0AAX6DG95_IRIPA|nr:Uncharacterized protein M6B38_248465 [Iris pallida]